MLAVPEPVKLINDGESRVVSVVIHAADVEEKVEAELLLCVRAHICDSLRVFKDDCLLTPELRGYSKKRGESFRECRCKIGGGTVFRGSHEQWCGMG
jgi:hypothetical protein